MSLYVSKFVVSKYICFEGSIKIRLETRLFRDLFGIVAMLNSYNLVYNRYIYIYVFFILIFGSPKYSKLINKQILSFSLSLSLSLSFSFSLHYSFYK